jgi:ribosome maturation factor RimP
MTLEEQVTQIVAPISADFGCELVGVDVIPGQQGGGRTTLRVYVDQPPKGIQLDTCSQISRQLDAVLAVELPDMDNYVLEVSSPGLNRLFFTSQQMMPYVGQTIKLRLQSAIEGRRQWTGTLVSVVDEVIVFESEGERVSAPFHQIERVRLVPDFSNIFRQKDVDVGQQGHEQ